jgi:hypothetical protein
VTSAHRPRDAAILFGKCKSTRSRGDPQRGRNCSCRVCALSCWEGRRGECVGRGAVADSDRSEVERAVGPRETSGGKFDRRDLFKEIRLKTDRRRGGERGYFFLRKLDTTKGEVQRWASGWGCRTAGRGTPHRSHAWSMTRFGCIHRRKPPRVLRRLPKQKPVFGVRGGC